MSVKLFLDFETTDLKGYAIEVAALLLKEKEDGGWSLKGGIFTALNPLAPVNEEVVRKFGIVPFKLLAYPRFAEIYPTLKNLIDKADCVVAHNARFDREVLERECRRIGKEVPSAAWECTLDLGKKIFGRRLSLERLGNACRVDSKEVELVYRKLLNGITYRPENIRVGRIKFHSALWDTLYLAFAYRKMREIQLQPSRFFKVGL